jgi:UDP-N-acetylmuramyl tripeptide synthase
VRAGMRTAQLSQRLGAGGGSIIGGRVTLTLDPAALSRLAAGRQVVLVSGTNGKTTTSHLLAAALRELGTVAHNASGSNMADGAVAALARDRDTRFAVIEVDELHLAAVAEAVDPAVIVLLNLSRDQLDRGNEVRAVAAALSAALIRHPRTAVVANVDDPMVVWAASSAARPVWVSAGSGWAGDTMTCPRCGSALDTTVVQWSCLCGLARPAPSWTTRSSSHPDGVTGQGAAVSVDGTVAAIHLRLPGRFNRGNAVMAIAAAAHFGADPVTASDAMSRIEDVAGRYALIGYGQHELRLLLAKNPAGWAETLGVIDEAKPLMIVVNAREADGRDTSWLWDVGFDGLRSPSVVACGERAADLGIRLSYADVPHTTVVDPLVALAGMAPGKVDVVANYSAFHDLRRRLASGTSAGAT